MKEKYDIFVSYRRSSSESANLIATRLRAEGYRVFFDVESLRGGKFNEQLFSVIDNCTDFLLILPPNALERCNVLEDWVRKEVLRAIAGKKNIIPIMLAGFEWPDPMPQGMEELCMYQAITPLPNTYYDMQIKKLQGYLKSKAHFRTRRKWLVGCGVATLVIALVLLVGQLTYMPAALRVADTLTLVTCTMNDLADITNTLQTEWEKYVTNWKNAQSYEDKADYKQTMFTLIALQERGAQKLLKTVQDTPVEVSEFHLPLLWLHGINPIELLIVNSFTEDIFVSLQEQIDKYRELMEDDNYSLLDMEMAKINAEIVSVCVNSYYYAYLQTMTHLPKSAQNSFYDYSIQWIHLPSVGLGLSDQEYERQQKLLNEKLEQELIYQEHLLLKTESDVEELQIQLDSLAAKAGVIQ